VYGMEDGQIVEQGTHEELLTLNSRYAGLWAMQSELALI
jgi:ABC-type multidrug transport system fused ATPase/permease subunit